MPSKQPTPQSPTPTLKYRIKLEKSSNVQIIDDKYNVVAKMVWYPDGLDDKTAREFVEAVNAYAALQAENAELREALDRMPCTSMRGCPPGMDSEDDAIKERHSTLCAYRIAQEALTRPPESRR